MHVNRQAARSAATRERLIAAARPLFAARGFADVGTEEIVRAAGVTRGALYHQFADKQALFAAVVEAVDHEVVGRVLTRAAEADEPIAMLRIALDGWLESATDPEVQRIVLLDAPAVLGIEAWREIAERTARGAVAAALQGAMDAGALAPRPVAALTDVLIGALDEGAMHIARADDPGRARAEVSEILSALLDALRAE